MPALTLDEQLIFDVAVALKKVKSLVFEGKWLRKAVLRSHKTIVQYLKVNRWQFSKAPLQ